MRARLISFILIFNCIVIYSQTIEETIDYINNSIIESTISAQKAYLFSKLEIDRNGKFTVNSFMNPFLNIERASLLESRSAYIKQLEFVELKELIISESQTNWVIILRCKDLSNCVVRQVKGRGGDNQQNMSFKIYNKEIGIRVKNAIIHLVNECIKNPNFREKDPFSNY